MAWTEDLGSHAVKLISGLEVLAAFDLAPVLVPLAALGLMPVMAGAAVVHARRKEP